MALAAQSQAHSSWGRWPQQLPQDFSMMENQGFLPYDNRTPTQPQMHRPVHTQYVVDAPYQTAPTYQNQHAFSYMPYQSPPPSTPIGSPYQKQQEASRLMTDADHNSRLASAYRRDSSKPQSYMPRSPISRSCSVSSAASKSHIPSPVVNAKTITYNETINPAHQVNFETDVDELMKAIQRKQSLRPEGHSNIQQILTPAQSPRCELMDPLSPTSTGTASTCEGKHKKKKWVCDGPNCNKSFVQKTHLDIHRRTHTGAKPYVCTKEGCGLTFSQRGNLKTHMRRHTGEKPYSCGICGKLFAQRGNVRSHEETHKGLKPFICRLDDCNKTFSQLGNMKTHQNNFHKETLQKLTSKFAQFIADGEVPPTHQELFEYFQEHYKNSNKGIKGRGKARTVAARKPKGSAAAASNMAPAAATLVTPSPSPSPMPMPMNAATTTSQSAVSISSISSLTSSSPVTPTFPQMPLHTHPSHSIMSGHGRVGSYDMGHAHAHAHAHSHPHAQPHSPIANVQQRSHAGAYSLFDQQQHHHQTSQTSLMYEDHSRQIGFAPRQY
ncbi:Asparagine-rich zinc finger protein AZF1 [Escovopsis weberi]|uniref:Asparagine-rich zinc finger protein AZF1 n=1 Tax=Escovopsis weberi TaxID=150374 RepID=A0A0M8N2T9_ESCWE|nr:Asparagine-rich zinc finger protein AZF1 [Escovopsis weberi]